MTRLMKLQAAGCIMLCVAAVATAANNHGIAGSVWDQLFKGAFIAR